MEVGGKILSGAAATALLAVIGHYATADDYVSGLEKSAQTELTAQGLNGVSVTFSRDPLSRHAILDGDVNDEMKQQALNAVSSIDNVSSARWAGDELTAGSDGAEDDQNLDPKTQSAISSCQAAVDQALAKKKITFRSGSAYVSPEANKLLDAIAAALAPCKGMSLAIGGHTDNNGNAEINKSMSQERADRIRTGLIERGMDQTLITSTGYGAEQPLDQQGGSAADAKNRRIEFKVHAANNDAKPQQGE